jgi:hypothetical protein
MKKSINMLDRIYINLKCHRILKRINTKLEFPVQAKEVKKVLVIFPKDVDLIDANQFIQKLRAEYRRWSVEIFDVYKIKPEERNILKMPNRILSNRLRKKNYDMVIDLNVPLDNVCAFIAVITEATYRVKITNEEQHYFNMQCSSSKENQRFFYQPLLDYLKRLFL